jgi:hypothetical protein
MGGGSFGPQRQHRESSRYHSPEDDIRSIPMKITPSCGCVFCDLNLKPIKNSLGVFVHGDIKSNQWIPCSLLNKRQSQQKTANTGHTNENGKKR